PEARLPRLRWESDSRLGGGGGVGKATHLSRPLPANGAPCPPAWRARAPWCHMGVSALPVTEQRVVSAGSAPGGTRTPGRLLRRSLKIAGSAARWQVTGRGDVAASDRDCRWFAVRSGT